MKTINLTKTVTTNTRHTIRLSAADLVMVMREAGLEVPPLARVTVHVPGGGDWSGVDHDSPITISWEVVQIKA